MHWIDKRMERLLSPEELEMIAEKGTKFLEDFKLQQSNKLYKDANYLYQRTQLKQLVKATEKYPQPLTDDDYTSEELIDHAFQELVDQSHYLTSLYNKVKKLELEVSRLKESSKYWRTMYLKRDLMEE